MIGLRGKIIIETASGGWVKNSMDLGWSYFATHSLLMPRLNGVFSALLRVLESRICNFHTSKLS